MSLPLSAHAMGVLLDRDSPHEPPPLEAAFLARQPILDAKNALIGYELLFRDGEENRGHVTDHLHATSVVLENLLSAFGLPKVLGSVDGFLNVDAEFLMSDLVDLLDPEKIVLELIETVDPQPHVIGRLKELRARGFRIALDDQADDAQPQALMEVVDIVKVDLSLHPPALLPKTLRTLQDAGVLVLAEKVETQEEFEHVRRLGFDLFQGYYFARPQMMAAKVNRRSDKIELLKLLNLILTDASVDNIERELKRHPVMSLNLLRLANSAAMGARVQIMSVRHAMLLAGRDQLRSWLQLMVYTGRADEDAARNPLLQMAAARAKLMELLMRRYPDASHEMVEAAFLTGMLSLVDALLNMSRADVVAQLSLADDIKEALLHETGRLGLLLAAVQRIEHADQSGLRTMLAQLPVTDLDALLLAELEAFAWANAISMG